MPLGPRRARQSHTAGQARRRTKFCPFASVSPKRHIVTRTRRFSVLPPTSRSERFCRVQLSFCSPYLSTHPATKSRWHRTLR